MDGRAWMVQHCDTCRAPAGQRCLDWCEASQRLESARRETDLRPVLRFVFDTADGEAISYTVTWKMVQDGEGIPRMPDVPDFLESSARRWDKPQQPILFTGRIKPGREDEAREWLEALRGSRSG